MSGITNPIEDSATKGKKCAWYMTVSEMLHRDGYKYPVFEWSYGFREGVRGGEVRAWPLQNLLLLNVRRGITLNSEELRGHLIDESGAIQFEPGQLEDLIQILTVSYDWGEPQLIRQILEDMADVHERLSLANTQPRRVFSELKEKWDHLVQQN